MHSNGDAVRKDYDLPAAQGSRVHNCGLCGKKYYESLLRDCPERPGRNFCAYCCRICHHHYQDGSTQGCREADALRKAKNTKGAA